ncbi:MAG TPA: hypothetical protein VL625_03595, partial [Patescibacteria group bacterium]|nr:hypothetical protein [Patescibacteria group bacterium]
AMNAYKGTAYNLGAKTGANGIDCSGFACKALTNAFANLRRDGIATPGAAQFNDSSEAQFEDINGKTGTRLQGSGRDFMQNGALAGRLKEGMVLASASGQSRGWNDGRALGIDHIACIYKDSKTGKLMVAESTSVVSDETGGDGVQRTSLENWLHRHRNKQVYATDPVKMVTDPAGPTSTHVIAAPTTPSSPTRTDDSGGGPSSKTPFNDSAQSAQVFKLMLALIAAACLAANSDGKKPAPTLTPGQNPANP